MIAAALEDRHCKHDGMHQAGGKKGNLKEKIEALVSPDEISKVYAFLASDEANMVKGSVRTR